ncbi:MULTISPECIES: lipase secretion chaperone [unclassified Moritella]|uniref:lipase secretion chaperone n=1 Tax=unclassified Moritella TaxID=2637987 RepID=UPI001BAA4297|nr:MULTISPECIES: lipase secretion chaperone [unclassified Moritella]QUM83642.1 hypothetical protein HWV02_03460 [Moritella sp. 28]QUM87936.1 hypothetical protein HWV03_03435 [Moritella sp. 36]
MQNINKSAAIISLFIISGTSIYLYSDNTSNTDITPPHTITMKENVVVEAKTSFASSIILRNKMTLNQKNNNTSTTSAVSFAQINMPKSLKNTDPSSLLHINNDNQLILNHDIKVLFDYFFSSEGDLTSPELLTSMQQYILQVYPQPAAQQALALLDKYVDYKQQMQDFHAQNSALQDLPELDTLTKSNTLQTVEALMQDRQDMREKIFSIAETDAMFGQEINYDQYMLTVAKLDADLSPTERQQQIEQTAQQYLTEAQQEARKQTFILQNTPANFRIDDRGECQGNNQDFTQQQVIALCNLARKRLARTESNS